jgi:hypothetical protein
MRSGEMSGWVKLTKEFTNDDLWFNTSAFRLYVWILLKASYRDGHITNGVELKKGQYIRAFSELGKDLMYIEGRSKKVLAKSTVKRAVDKLVKKGLLEAEETPLGTKFTIVNFDQFKCLEGTSDFFCPPYRETERERKDDPCETEAEQKKEYESDKNLLKQQDSSSYTAIENPVKKTEDVKEIVEFWDANGFGFTNVNAKQQLLSWLDDSRFLQPSDDFRGYEDCVCQ